MAAKVADHCTGQEAAVDYEAKLQRKFLNLMLVAVT